MKIFGGSSNLNLAKSIGGLGGLGNIKLEQFPSGERYCRFLENIRGEDVYLIQSLNSPVNDYYMELLVMIDAAKRASASRVTAVVPYMGYLRQDRKTKGREPITARLIAKVLEVSGADKIISMDFHCGQAQGFFDIPVDHLNSIPVIANYLNGSVDVVVSPDIGGVKRAHAYTSVLGCDFAFVDKERKASTKILTGEVSGDVDGKTVLIVDDMVESGGTLIGAAKACKKEGASKVICAVSHGVFSPMGKDRFKHQNYIDEFLYTDSVNNKTKIQKAGFRKLTVSNLFREAIYRSHNNESVSELFEVKGF